VNLFGKGSYPLLAFGFNPPFFVEFNSKLLSEILKLCLQVHFLQHELLGRGCLVEKVSTLRVKQHCVLELMLGVKVSSTLGKVQGGLHTCQLLVSLLESVGLLIDNHGKFLSLSH